MPTKSNQTFWMKNCYTKDTLQQTIFKKKHGWTALDTVGAGSSKFNGESAREHQGALILGL